MAYVLSCALAAVPTTFLASPDPAFTLLCACVPKCHWLPFLVWSISGSRPPELFLVEFEVPPMTGPLLTSKYLCTSVALTAVNIYRLS